MNLEDSIRRQADILDLANAWMETHRGVVAPGVMITREEWIDRIQQLPVWRTVQEDISGCARYLRLHHVQKTSQDIISKQSFLLDNALTAQYLFTHFLADPEYCSDTRNGFGAPKTLATVLRDYTTLNESRGAFEHGNGICRKIDNAIDGVVLTQKEFLESIGFEERWEIYQCVNGIPREHRRLATIILEHFLTHPDYCSDSHNSFGAPKRFESVMRDYSLVLNEGEGGFSLSKGDCHKVYLALRLKRITKDGLLDSIGLREKWEKYQTTTGIPLKHRNLAKKVLTHFLANPDYSNNNHNPFGSPIKLASLLGGYSTMMNGGEGGFVAQKGEAKNVYQALYNTKFTEEELLASIGLAEQWQQYQSTSGISRGLKSLAKITLDYFLKNPTYYVDHQPARSIIRGAPITLRSLFRSFSIAYGLDAEKSKWNDGDCRSIYRFIQQHKLTEEKLLESIGLLQAWQDYIRSSRDSPFVYDPQKYLEGAQQ